MGPKALGPTVVFDLDGTLVDTAPDLLATLDWLLDREGLPRLPYEAARNLVGGGARSLIERGLAAEGRRLQPKQIDLLVADFVAEYSAHIADRSRPFPGLEAALDALAGAGCRFAVCTNKLERLSKQLLDKLGLSRRFATICGGDTFGMQKPDPELLHRTIARAAGIGATTVMVGDSIADVALARAAGVPVVLVDFGYSEIPVAALGADRVISRLGELPAAVLDLVPMAAAATKVR
jgi:phosphoglycolate phosphatase